MIRKINTHITRALAVFALFTLLFAAFPARSQAAASTVYFGSTALKNDNAWHSYNQSGSTISGWTAGRYRLSTDSSTLYIDGLSFSISAQGTAGITSDRPLKIVATGTNNINCSGTGASGIVIYDPSVFYGDLTLSGGDSSAKINIVSKGYDVAANNCTITNVTLSGINSTYGDGLHFDGTLTMNSGTIMATDLEAEAFNVAAGNIRVQNDLTANNDSKTSVIRDGLVTAGHWGLFYGPVELKGGTLTGGELGFSTDLTQTGGFLISNEGIVVLSTGDYIGSGGTFISKTDIQVMRGNMLLSGTAVRASTGMVDIAGNLILTGGSLTSDRFGINVGKNLNISGSGRISAYINDKSSSDDPDAWTAQEALWVGGSLTSAGGTITATSNSGNKGALSVSGRTDITGGTITATISNSSNPDCAASFSGEASLKGGRLIANGNTASWGMYCGDSIQINNDAVLSASSGANSPALWVYGGFTLNNGTVTLNAENYVALGANNVAMTGGKLTMNGSGGAWSVQNDAVLADDIWISQPQDGTIQNRYSYGYPDICEKSGLIASRAVLQKVSSISVSNEPSGDYYEGDCLDPDDLVLSVRFADGATALLSYKTHKDMFSFSPSLTQSLSSGRNTFNVTCLTKKTSFDVTQVKKIGATTLSGTAGIDRNTVSWTRADGAYRYDLYGKEEGESSFRCLSNHYTEGSYIHKNLSPGETWEYYIVPVRRTNTGADRSGTASNHITLTTSLEAPVIRVTGSTYDSVSLEWSKSEGADRYRVYIKGEGSSTVVGNLAEEERYTARNLITGREYTFYVKAWLQDKNIYSDASNVVKVTPQFNGGTVLSVINSGKYELSWNATEGATGYEIRRGNGAGGGRTVITTIDANATSFTDDSADIYTVYNYSVIPVRKGYQDRSFPGKESNVVVTEPSVKPEPEPESEPEIVPPSGEEPAGTEFNLLQARSGKVTKSSIQIKWKKVSGAKKYIVYGNKCGSRYKYKKLKTTTKNALNFKTVAGKKVKKGTYFKFLVYAVDANGEIISTSKTVHVATKGGKVGNDKSVTTAAKKNKVTLRKGKTFKLKAKSIPASKKLKVNRHRKIAYETSNKKVAKVTSKGVIKATGKGTCYVYAYTQNGVFAKVKVTVK